ncbi:SMP-30/gluconolactonase/LRE family protein [Novosphingobium tardum]|uniref:SMP-30/gluconolactonase/LRE family protein n=1 Tax=Novosphingobium tardum TaxID=1538021 RepID=A0ABV8RUF3_9SPHN
MSAWELVAENLAFPEGPTVMEDGSVIVVELGAGKITRCWNGRSETVAEPGGGPNGAAIGADGALYVCNSGGVDFARMCNATGAGAEGRIERIDLGTGKVERIYDACDGEPLSAPNDLMFAPDGRFWFTDLGKRYGRIAEASGLFNASADGSSIACIHHGAVGYNGVGVLPDGKTVVVADTFQARVYAFDARVARQSPRLVATVPGYVGLDSLAITAAGNICIGTLQEGGISQVSLAGEVSKPFAFDDPYVTNIAFGGADMRDAFITCSATGRLIKTRWAEPGLRLAFHS